MIDINNMASINDWTFRLPTPIPESQEDFFFAGGDFKTRSPEQKTLIYEKAGEEYRKLLEKLAPGKTPFTENDLSIGDLYTTYELLHHKTQQILKMLKPSNRWFDEYKDKPIRIENLLFIPRNRLLIWEYEPNYSRSIVLKAVREKAKERFEEMIHTYKGRYSVFNIKTYEKEIKDKKIKAPTTSDLPMIIGINDKYIAHPLDVIREMKKRNKDIVLKNAAEREEHKAKEKEKNISRVYYEENFPKITNIHLKHFRG